MGLDILLKNGGTSVGGTDKAQQSADSGTFSGTVRSDKAEEIPFLHGEIQVCNASGFAVGFGQVFCFYNRQSIPPVKYIPACKNVVLGLPNTLNIHHSKLPDGRAVPVYGFSYNRRTSTE